MRFLGSFCVYGRFFLMSKGMFCFFVVLLCSLCRGTVFGALPFKGFYKNFFSVSDTSDNFRPLGVSSRDCSFENIQRFSLKFDVKWLRQSVRPFVLSCHYEAQSRWGDLRAIEQRLVHLSGHEKGVFLGKRRARFFDLERAFVEKENFVFGHGLNRLQVKRVFDKADLIVGRQAVTWGTGFLWSPLDLFSGFAPNEIDRDEKGGVDVLRGVFYAQGDSCFDLVFEPLDEEKAYSVKRKDSSLAVRAKAHVGEYDVSLVAGEIVSDVVVGGDFVGYVGDAGLHGEWVFTWVDEKGQRDYFRGLVGVDCSFPVKFDPYVAVEYFFNGLGEADKRDYWQRMGESSFQRSFVRGNSFNIGRDYAGVLLRVLPHPLLSFQSQTLVNLGDSSVLEFGSVSWALCENVDLIFGVNLFFGRLGSEFGGWSSGQVGVDFRQPDFCFSFLKFYF